ncbi:MAG: hypothetical protein HQK65_22970 [Desulfamplus sp.]|nr:hypothetical protein [Desulfamplus sp.]
MLLPEMLNKRYMSIYPKAAEQADIFRAMKGNEMDWPDWCYLPVGAAHTVIWDECNRQGLAIEKAIPDVGNLAAILNWRITKGVYRFDKELLDSLWDVTLDKDIPADVIFDRLPEYCCYIDLESYPKSTHPGFFVYLEHDVNTGHREIRFTFAIKNEDTQDQYTLANIPFHAGEKSTVIEMLRETWEYSQRQTSTRIFELSALDNADVEKMAESYYPYFSLVLYLCSSEPDIIQTSKNKRKVKKTKNPKKQKRALPTEYRVGATIGATIRRAKENYSSSGATGTGSKKSPHIRKAHYHLYWTGKGRKIPKLNFVAPMTINIGKEPDLPIVKRVK